MEQVNWKDSLPEDLRGSKVLDNISDVDALAKQYIEAQSFIGQSIRIPSEDAGDEAREVFNEKLMSRTNLMRKPETPEDYAEVYKSMGKPDEANGYKLPEGVEGDYGDLMGMAHTANMTGKQFESFITQVKAAETTNMETAQAAHEESINGVRKDWGAAYDQNTKQAIGLLEATGAPASVIEEAKAGKVNGDALRWFHSLAQKISGGEASNASADQGGDNTMTPMEASNQLDELMGNKKSPYWNIMDPRHQEFQKKAMALRKLRAHKG